MFKTLVLFALLVIVSAQDPDEIDTPGVPLSRIALASDPSKCLSVSETSELILSECTSDENQNWINNEMGKIMHASTSKCIKLDSTNAILGDCTNVLSEQIFWNSAAECVGYPTFSNLADNCMYANVTSGKIFGSWCSDESECVIDNGSWWIRA